MEGLDFFFGLDMLESTSKMPFKHHQIKFQKYPILTDRTKAAGLVRKLRMKDRLKCQPDIDSPCMSPICKPTTCRKVINFA